MPNALGMMVSHLLLIVPWPSGIILVLVLVLDRFLIRRNIAARTHLLVTVGLLWFSSRATIEPVMAQATAPPLSPAAAFASAAQRPLRERLKDLPFQIAYECYTNDNWEIFVVGPDGTRPVNLTRTPQQHEHYPQVSPDGCKICFSVDQGEGREAARSLWIMDSDGQHRRKLVDSAREPFWSPDGKSIGFLLQEYPKFDAMDYYTKGMCFYDLATGKITPHPNSTNLHHLYNPCFASNGQWIVATVHGGMGVSHGIVAIATHGSRIVNLNLPGCRAWLSPDGRQIAWGAGDYEIDIAPI